MPATINQFRKIAQSLDHTDGETHACYIAGPMSGITLYNFPAFEDATAMLTEAGFFVFSPHLADFDAGEEPREDGVPQYPLKHYMVRDLPMVCKSDCLFLLPGWEDSTGAMLEFNVATMLKIPCYLYENGAKVIVMGTADDGDLILSLSFDHLHEESEIAVLEPDMSQFKRMLDALPERHPLSGEKIYRETLPTGSEDRKGIPIVTGLLDYFPAALAEVAKVSKAGNDKHNPGQPMHWARGKSMDQADCVGRHLIERGGIDPETGERHTAQLAWRALALLQVELEEAGLAPLSRGSREEE